MPTESALATLSSLAKKRELPRVCLIHGPNAFLREYVLDRLRECQGSAQRLVLLFQIGGGADAGGLPEAVGAHDLFGKAKLVCCRVLRTAKVSAEDGGTAAGSKTRRGSSGEDALAAAIEQVADPHALLIIYDKDAASAAIRRLVEQVGLVVMCNRPFENQMVQYVGLFARALGVKLGAAEAETLAERFGTNLSALNNALVLASLSGVPASPEGADVGPLMRASGETFELAESIGRGKLIESFTELDRALAIGRDPTELLALELIPALRRMRLAAALMSQPRPEVAMSEALGYPPTSPMVAKALQGARRYGARSLEETYAAAVALDQNFKMGTVKGRAQALSHLLLRLTEH